MKVEEWQKGINISINNGIELYENGKLLIDKGSYGHGLFLFITALEEISVAYFIMILLILLVLKNWLRKNFLNITKRWH